MTDKRCPDCKFAVRASNQLNGPMQCRRNPPSVFMVPIGAGQISMNTTFPQVDATTWCGEFASKGVKLADVNCNFTGRAPMGGTSGPAIITIP